MKLMLLFLLVGTITSLASTRTVSEKASPVA
jgi:hypothetical protein